MTHVFAGLIALTALAQPMTPEAWRSAHEYDCNAAFEHFAPADEFAVGDFHYRWSGGSIAVTREGKAHPARVGLLAGLKDADPETQVTLKQFLAAFEAADVDVIVVGGDSAESPEGLDAVFGFLAQATQRPVVLIAGNSERASAMNYAIAQLQKDGARHLINMNLVRRYDGPGVDLVSVAGYYDKAFLHMAGGCIITEAHLQAAKDAAKASNDPVVLIAHGPPRFSGQKTIDYVPSVGNVGDPRLNELMTDAHIQFGVFGHILEAGGLATDLKGAPVAEKKKATSLLVNQGSANPLPWKLNTGKTSYGLAAILTLEGKQASYQMLRGTKPEAR